MHIDAEQLGKYELRERLGQGGMAEVWKAFDTRLQRFVAIKFMHPMLRSDPTFITRFLREAQAVASLHHPNIVQIYDFETPAPGDEKALTYMVMDYIEGQTLADFLQASSRKGQFLLDGDLVALFYSISDAIDYAHRHGLLHRDIKPANILLDRRNTVRNSMGEPILTDFGIVKIIGSSAGTLTNSSMGTPLYISPEQAQGHPDTAASDLYSLGVVLYEACAGRPPFQGTTPFAILQQHLTTPPPPPEQFNPAISLELSAVILRSLAKKPEERYPSAMALVAALAVALDITLPDRRALPISSPDIRLLSGSPDALEEAQTHMLNNRSASPQQPANPSSSMLPTAPPASPQASRVANPRTPMLPISNPPSPMPPVANPASPLPAANPISSSPEVFFMPPADQLPTLVPAQPPRAPSAPASAQGSRGALTSVQAPRPPQTEQPARVSRRNVWLTVLAAILIVVLAGSGLTAYQIARTRSLAQSAPAAPVGQVFFISTGNGNGAQNQGLNDQFQISLSHLPAPAAGKQYYAWLLPDTAQAENSVRALGPLRLRGGVAALSYTDPQHMNLIGLFSRFLVTEEAADPAPISPSLDKAAWRYYAEIPQDTVIKNCAGVTVTQLSVLCHLRHLLSGDPDLAQVNLQGGLNHWFLNNVKEMVKWAQEALDHNGAVDIRYKLVNILYVLSGPACIQQNMQKAFPGAGNVIDDQTLPMIAALPLLDCPLTPTLPGYVTHINNHLHAMLSSPGASSNQKKLAGQINPELSTVNMWLKEVETDAMQLVAMSDQQLIQPTGKDLRNALATQATEVLSGGTDAVTDLPDQGVQSISLQIQGLARLDVTAYSGH